MRGIVEPDAKANRSRPTPLVAVGVGVAVAGALAIVASVLWPLIGLTAVFTHRALRARASWELALSGAVVVPLGLPLAAFASAELLHLPAGASVSTAWIVAALASGYAFTRALGKPRVGREPGVRLVAAMSVGSALWALALAASRLVGGSRATAWAMQGDALNHLNHAREIASGEGVAGSGIARLAQVLLAQTVGSDGTAGAAAALAHDIDALAATWATYVAVMAFLLGAVAWSILTRFPGIRPWLVVAATAACSALGLSWFMSGLAFEAGFLNAPLAVIVVTVTLLTSLAAREHPTFALALLFVLVILAVATWGPIAAAPAFAAAPLLPRAVRAPRARVAVVVAVGLLGTYAALHVRVIVKALTVTVTEQGFMEPLPRWILPLALVAVATLALTAPRGAARRDLLGLLAPTIGLGVAALAMVALGGDLLTWPYYPRKGAWLSTASLIVPVVALSLGSAWVRIAARGVRIAAVVAVFAAVGLGATIAYVKGEPRAGQFARTPVAEAWGGYFGDPARELTGPGGLITGRADVELLWRSDLSPYEEQMVNTWILRLRDPSTNDERPVRALAYHLVPGDAAQLCGIPDTVRAHVVIHTADPGLSAEVLAICPDIDAVFRVDR